MNKIIIKGINEEILTETLDNGLRVYLWVKETLNTFYATYSVKYGSLHTKFKVGRKVIETPYGVAHFLEHVKFNLSANRTGHQVFNELGSDTNAFTTFKYTNYQVLGNKNACKNVLQLLDLVDTRYFTKQIINKEKGIITEEAGMGSDNPYMISMYGLLKNVFKAPERSALITGSKDDIKNISLKDIEDVYDSFYHPENSFLIVTGNFNPYEMIATIKENQTKKNFPKYANPSWIKGSECKKVVNKYEETEANVANYKIKIGIKIPNEKIDNLSEFEVASYLRMIMKVNFGSTSNLKNELVDEELINNIYYNLFQSDDYFCIVITIDTEYKEEVLERVSKVLDNLNILEKDFIRIKRANLATFILNYEDAEVVNSLIQDDIILYDEIIANKKEIMENMNYDDINKVIAKIDWSNRSVHITKPYENEK